jgi:hypothetical protein
MHLNSWKLEIILIKYHLKSIPIIAIINIQKINLIKISPKSKTFKKNIHIIKIIPVSKSINKLASTIIISIAIITIIKPI